MRALLLLVALSACGQGPTWHQDIAPIVERTPEAAGDMRTQMRCKCQNMSRLIENAVDNVGRIITDLRPSILDHQGLWAALEAYFAQRRALGFRLVEEEQSGKFFQHGGGIPEET